MKKDIGHEFKVNDDGVTPMEKFASTTTDITIKSNHRLGCPVCVLYARLQVNVYVLPNWVSQSRAGLKSDLTSFAIPNKLPGAGEILDFMVPSDWTKYQTLKKC